MKGAARPLEHRALAVRIAIPTPVAWAVAPARRSVGPSALLTCADTFRGPISALSREC